MPLFREAQQGQPDAQLAVGKMYLGGGSGLKRDPATACYWLRKAASGGNHEARRLIGDGTPDPSANKAEPSVPAQASPNADIALADWLLTGQVEASEDVNAMDVLRRAARLGERTAQLRLAILLQSGEHGPEEAEEAVHWLQRAAEGGSRAAAVRLADWYWEKSDPAAGTWLERLGASAEPELLYRMGIVFAAKGRSAAASTLLAKAAQADHVPAQVYYGLLHASPLGKRATGVPHSLKRAASWLEKASHGGSGQASFELYRLFRLRQFSLKNAALAQKYLETAARQAHPHAQFLSALAFMRDSVSRDSDLQAATWLLRAAKQGHAQAGSMAALLYSKRPAPSASLAAEQARLARVLARTRIALATRLELAQALRLTIAELLLFDPEAADREDFIVLDVRRHSRGARRRIVAIETEAERALLDRARRLLASTNPHPTDVRGSLSQRRLDLEQTMRLLGRELGEAFGS